jgi:O-antigen/teichoic acid export membrane protein
VVESLNGIPNAVAAGAMPSLTREALQGLRVVRERVAGMMALLAVPGAVGLALSAAGVVALLGESYEGAAAPLRVLALALVPLFMNTVLLQALIAAGHAGTLPRLTGVRVGLAAVLAVVLIPPLGAMGAAAGFLLSETLLTFVAARACARVGFAVPVSGPLARAAALAAPMAVAVAVAGRGLGVSGALGVATYTATLAATGRLKPELVPLRPPPSARGLAE